MRRWRSFAGRSPSRPDQANTQVNLGSVLEELGRIDEARAAFEAAVALEPRNVRFRYAR